MRSSPQVGFSIATRRMSLRSSSGMGGRPGRDFQRHRSRHPARCHRIIVSGRTITRAERQSKSREMNASDARATASTRLGLMPRSRYSPSCRRRRRFSASTDRRDRKEKMAKLTRSVSSRKTMWAKRITQRSCHSIGWPSQAESPGSNFCGGQDQCYWNLTRLRPSRFA
jgi:hypothetical protein